ncbi:MAG TPA: methylglyoxal synthase, partial [Paludibacter sp.]|nr:methylglyoxal synthase [Paludibacter sp.]
MKKQLKIALVAHDARKADMVEWAVFNSDMLSQHKLICTGTTGGLIQEAFENEGIEVEVERKNSGPMGGDAEIAAMVVNKQIDFCVFLIDD